VVVVVQGGGLTTHFGFAAEQTLLVIRYNKELAKMNDK
jgi:hypothetical protein